jgi:hypothetical protein
MKTRKAPYSVDHIISEIDYKYRDLKIEANVQALMLGPSQSRRYYELIATILNHKPTVDRAFNELSKYQGDVS